jgi:hypothetical protein
MRPNGETFEQAPTYPASNVRSHTGTVVHAGKWVRASHTERGWLEAPACGLRRNSVLYGMPTTEPITCKRCLP